MADLLGDGVVAMFVPQLMVAEENLPLSPAVNAYFKQYCHRCHGETMQKGDRRLDRLPFDGRLDDTAVTLLEEALDAVNRGDMPPNKKGVSRPPAEQTRHVVKAMTQFLDDRLNASKPATTTLRRLNRFEYVNTLRDLLGLHTEASDPTGDFPVDAREDGFDNIGEALILSDYQLQRYLEVAEDALEQATEDAQERLLSSIQGKLFSMPRLSQEGGPDPIVQQLAAAFARASAPKDGS